MRYPLNFLYRIAFQKLFEIINSTGKFASGGKIKGIAIFIPKYDLV